MMNQSWQASVSTLECLGAQEDGFLSDGDEPYLIVVGFYSKFATHGSTKVWRLPIDGDKWPKSVEANGSAFSIDPVAGVITFPDISTEQALPDVLGFAVICCEHDATPFSTIASYVDRGVAALHDQLVSLIESAQLNPATASQQLSRLAQLSSRRSRTRSRTGWNQAGISTT